MSDINITIPGGASKRLLTKGKLCDKNIVVTAQGGADRYEEGYQKGYDEGNAEGIKEGIEEGKQAEHDAFWDSYQQNGNRRDYRYAFGGSGWADNAFTPKYNMQPNMATNMFANADITDLPAALERAGVTLDFSNTSNMQQVFLDSKLKHLGVVDLSYSPYCTYVFAYTPNLETIDEIIFSEKNVSIASAFESCTALKNIKCSGVIRLSISLAQSSQLTNESVQSIIDHLKDLTGATAQTLTFHATVGGNMTAEQKAAITAKNWQLVY
jgi:hypothetical protein